VPILPIFTIVVRERYHKKTKNQVENTIKHFGRATQAKNALCAFLMNNE